MLHMKLSKWTSKAGMSAFLMFSLSSGRFMLSWRLKRVEIVLKKTTECSRHWDYIGKELLEIGAC